jgi:hypothetical protein
MASRMLELKFLGDTRDLSKSFRDAGRSVDEFGAKADKHKTSLKSYAAGLGKAGVAGALAAAGVFLASSVKAAVNAEKAQAKLTTTLKAAGISWHAHAGQIDTTIRKTSDLSGITDTDLKGAFTNIVRVTGDHPGGLQQALKLTAVAADLARAKHMDVAKAGELVGKVAGGNTSVLKRYGIIIDKGASSTEALGILQHKFAGQAKAYGETTAGAQDRFKAAVNRLQVEVGTKLIPALTKLILVALDVVDSAGKVVGAFKSVAEKVTGFAGGVPAKIGLAIVSAPVFLLTNAGRHIMSSIWDGFKGAAGAIADAAKWLKNKVVDAVKSAFGISSPSKVFEELGQNMTAGLIKGLDPSPVGRHLGSFTGVGNHDRAAASAPSMAGWFAGGGDFVVNGPTMFGAGEAGPERVQVTPLGRGNGGGGVHINMHSPVFTSPRQPAAFGRRLAWRLAIT